MNHKTVILTNQEITALLHQIESMADHIGLVPMTNMQYGMRIKVGELEI